MMRRFPRHPHPLSSRTRLAWGFPLTPGPLCDPQALKRSIFGFPFGWNPPTRKSSFPPLLWLTLPAWKLPPYYPLANTFCAPSWLVMFPVSSTQQ